jgi:hypothetical protein
MTPGEGLYAPIIHDANATLSRRQKIPVSKVSRSSDLVAEDITKSLKRPDVPSPRIAKMVNRHKLTHRNILRPSLGISAACGCCIAA